MNYLKLNDFQCQLLSFNKYTNFNDSVMSGNCSCQIVTDNISGLQALGLEEITSLQIMHEDNLIYDLQNISAHMTSISEYLSNDKIDITLTLNF